MASSIPVQVTHGGRVTRRFGWDFSADPRGSGVFAKPMGEVLARTLPQFLKIRIMRIVLPTPSQPQIQPQWVICCDKIWPRLRNRKLGANLAATSASMAKNGSTCPVRYLLKPAPHTNGKGRCLPAVPMARTVVLKNEAHLGHNGCLGQSPHLSASFNS